MTDKTYIPMTPIELFAARVLKDSIESGTGWSLRHTHIAHEQGMLVDPKNPTKEGKALLKRLAEHDRREEIVKLRARLEELEGKK